MSVPSAPAVPSASTSTRRGGRAERVRERPPAGVSRTAGYYFVALYVALLLLLGIAPAVYAIYLAVTGPGHFGSNFTAAVTDYRFLPAFEHVGEYVAIWLVSQTVLIIGLVLMIHHIGGRLGTTFRFLFYIPGAVAGAASVIVWLFVLDPTASPFAFILHWLGFSDLDATVSSGALNLPIIFAVMAFWTGAGGWIVVMYGALNNIPTELIEAAEIDGSNAFQTAFLVKLPLIRKWIVYMLVLSFAGGTQLFTEPTVLAPATSGIGITKYWSPNTLAWFLASQYDQFNEAAAIAIILLVGGLVIAALLVWRGRLFEVD